MDDEKQRAVYQLQAREYERLVRAEDADGRLAGLLSELLPLEGARALDVGCGTGRVARLLLALGAREVLGVDRAPAMLAVARESLAKELAAGRVELREGDARSLALEGSRFDVATAGWCFGHFRHWMPEGWREEVSQALGGLLAAVRPGGAVVVLETLGTGYEEPRFHPALEEYFAVLEARGFQRHVVRTDYAFASVQEAKEVLGVFFPASLLEAIERAQWSRVPECTGVWTYTRPAA